MVANANAVTTACLAASARPVTENTSATSEMTSAGEGALRERPRRAGRTLTAAAWGRVR